MPNAQKTVTDRDVVIVGGGLAGLAAGVGLAACGLNTLVLEKAPILGGRARSWTDPETGDAVTVGPHIFLSEYPNMRKLMRILKTEDRIVWQKGKFITIVDGQKETDIKMSPLPPPLNWLPCMLRERDFFPLRDLLSNNRVSRLCMQIREEDVLRLDEEDALTVLRNLGVTERWIRQFWAFTCQAIMNVPIEQCSAGALLRFFHYMTSRTHFDVGFADRGLGDLFAPQAKDFIEKRGGKVETGVGVKTVAARNGRAAGVILEDGTEISARQVLVTLPPMDMNQVIPEEWAKRHSPFKDLAAFGPSPYISTYLWFDKKLTRQQFWARNYNENDMNCDFYDYSNIYSKRATDHSFITTNCIYSARLDHLSDEEVVEKTLEELAEYLPAAKKAKLTHSLVSRIPMAIHCPSTGTEKLRPAVRTPVPGLFVAGDWIKTGVPASMESACTAAFMAAEEILADEKKPRKLAEPMKRPQGLSGLLWRASPTLRKLPFFSPGNYLR
ncbi:MAG: FAD-dependent oxidoreductase [Proteobacteria bacterium]|nr:FAD-dependent oxidoreductase [Pseudomonadota bacterium]